MDRFINFELLKSPYNWVIVFAMTAFALFLLSAIAPEEVPGQ